MRQQESRLDGAQEKNAFRDGGSCASKAMGAFDGLSMEASGEQARRIVEMERLASCGQLSKLGGDWIGAEELRERMSRGDE